MSAVIDKNRGKFKVWIDEALSTEYQDTRLRCGSNCPNRIVKLKPGTFTINISAKVRCAYEFYFVNPDGTIKHVMGEKPNQENGGSFDPDEGDFHDVYQGPRWSNKRFTFDPNSILENMTPSSEHFPNRFKVVFYPEVSGAGLHHTSSAGNLVSRGAKGSSGNPMRTRGAEPGVVLTGEKTVRVGLTDRKLLVDRQNPTVFFIELQKAD